jgi:hypothetical protein
MNLTHTVETEPAMAQAGSMTPSLALRRALAVAAVLLALAIGVPRFLTHTPYPRLGIVPNWEHASGRLAVSQVVGPPGKGLLEAGDLILEVNGRTLARSELRESVRKGGWPREAMTMRIERRGRILDLVIPPLRLSAWQRVRSYTLPIAAVVAVPIVAFLLVWRRPDLGTAWAFLWFACLQGLAAIYDLYRYPQGGLGGWFTAYLSGYHFLKSFLPAGFLHFMTVFPRPRWRSSWAIGNPWFIAVVLAYLTPPALFVIARNTGSNVDDLYVWYETATVVLGTLSLVERYGRPARPEWSPAFGERVIALVVALALLAATVFGVFGAIADDPRIAALYAIPVFRVLLTVVTVAWLSSPLLIAFLIANDPAFDPRRLLVKSLPYAVLSGFFAAIYLLIVLLSQRLFIVATGEEAMAFNVIAALIVAFAFAPLRDRLQGWLDRLYGRDPGAIRAALDRAGHELLGALDRHEIRGSIEAGLERAFKRPVALDWPESGAPRIADAEDVPLDHRPAVENLLVQAGVRLENLALQELRGAAERRAVELRELATRAELRALHAQVQPHFLFNALNALAYLIESDPPAASRFSERLADMLRYTVEAGDRPAALLSEEIGFVEDYLGVARERYENSLAFEYRGAPELLGTPVPPLLLQPLVENSLKHGCAPGADALHLTLEARRENGWISLDFVDDGVLSGNGGPSLGVGLQNLEQRLVRFAGRDARLEAKPRDGGGFRVSLSWRSNKEAA